MGWRRGEVLQAAIGVALALAGLAVAALDLVACR